MNADPGSQSLIAQLLLLIVLTLVNAFLAASEIAVVSINKSRIEQQAEEGDKKSQNLLHTLKDPTNFLSTIQVGITLVNILSGASLASQLAERLSPYLGGGAAATSMANVIMVVLLTYISIVFGELYPKRIAMGKTEEVAKFAAGIIRVIGKIAKPFVWLLSASTNLLARITPMEFDDEENKMTRDEMRYMMETEGVFEDEELSMLQGVFSLDTKVAREVMVPRTDTYMVDINDNVSDVIQDILKQNYSRIPIFNEEKDKVIGVLHTKNLLKGAYKQGFDNIDLLSLLQEPLFVPETVFIDDLLYEMKKTQNQMAILLDEYGGVVGIVTLEDLLEEIVGEIDDESDEVETLYKKVSDSEYIIQGGMLIDEFNEAFDTNLHMSDVDTMAGYLITALGEIPEEGEKLTFDVDNLTLVSEQTVGSRVLKIRVIFHDLDETEGVEPEEERRFFHKDFEDDEPRR
ncbi:hemolysin family protein [Tetragenococcus koreensis]|uniref:Hemolysin-like protein n=1 Tax=Tetragenococcus koreensis TaxID=290335 RepID=A0AAN4UDA7_9ENTE|nr:hemolysin family protein [Tetragenococcus koreensis]AYW44687.1 HlyC/CorC family transporter [Tetragenococcus koreensis]MCF1584174.1 hemolysin family protein [Tetragenococcus koreensis]MCF1613693.1 hemolysin family protein [Tetragenococcus koreensis]MCF1616266.1 hemolysin family protein [Tetragenococcus koreensis]MCF1618984.1 hemolysin family protein [Tetragenococcus koreensis]